MNFHFQGHIYDIPEKERERKAHTHNTLSLHFLYMQISLLLITANKQTARSRIKKCRAVEPCASLFCCVVEGPLMASSMHTSQDCCYCLLSLIVNKNLEFLNCIDAKTIELVGTEMITVNIANKNNQSFLTKLLFPITMNLEQERSFKIAERLSHLKSVYELAALGVSLLRLLSFEENFV